jgi:hypothetical protein
MGGFECWPGLVGCPNLQSMGAWLRLVFQEPVGSEIDQRANCELGKILARSDRRRCESMCGLFRKRRNTSIREYAEGGTKQQQHEASRASKSEDRGQVE